MKVSVLQDIETKFRTIMVVAHATANINPYFLVRYFVDMEMAADFIEALAALE